MRRTSTGLVALLIGMCSAWGTPLRQITYAKAIGSRSWFVGIVMWQHQTTPLCQS
jgi:hypothetical protein